MIRQIIIPTSNAYTLHLPDEMVGKKIEILAFDLNRENNLDNQSDLSTESAKLKVIEYFDSISVDTSDVPDYKREDLYD